MLAQRQQPVLLHRHCDTGTRMRVDDAIDLRPRLMHATVNDEAGIVHAQPGHIVDDVTFMVDLDDARRSDLVEHESIRIDQDVRRTWHTRGEMREYQVGPAELACKLVGRRKFATHFPLFRADTVTNATGFDGFELSGFIGHLMVLLMVLLVWAIIHFICSFRPRRPSCPLSDARGLYRPDETES